MTGRRAGALGLFGVLFALANFLAWAVARFGVPLAKG